MTYTLWWRGRGLQPEKLKHFPDLTSLVEWQDAWRKRQVGYSLPDSDFWVTTSKTGGATQYQEISLASAKLQVQPESLGGSTSSPSRSKSTAEIVRGLPDGPRPATEAQTVKSELQGIQELEEKIEKTRTDFEDALQTILREMGLAE